MQQQRPSTPKINKQSLKKSISMNSSLKSESRSVVFDSLWPHGPYSRWNSQVRILEWVAFPFSRGSSQPRDQTQVSRVADGFFTSWATREALFIELLCKDSRKSPIPTHPLSHQLPNVHCIQGTGAEQRPRRQALLHAGELCAAGRGSELWGLSLLWSLKDLSSSRRWLYNWPDPQSSKGVWEW